MKKPINVFALEEDKEIIKKASEIQRRSMASFIIESSVIRAKEVLKENGD